MPRPGSNSGYDPATVCAFCIDNLNSAYALILEEAMSLIDEQSLPVVVTI
jgi:hypothetical protein